MLLLGGLIAAPIAAWLVRHIPPRMLGSLVGGVIVLTNTRTLLKSDWIDAPDSTRIPIYIAIYLVWAAAVVWSYLQYRKDKAVESADAIAAIAEAEGISEANVVATSAPLESEVSAGRPSAPQD